MSENCKRPGLGEIVAASDMDVDAKVHMLDQTNHLPAVSKKRVGPMPEVSQSRNREYARSAVEKKLVD